MIKNEGLLEEFKYVTVPDEQEHIEGLFASGDELMQDIAYNLISGNNTEVGVLVKKALDEGAINQEEFNLMKEKIINDRYVKELIEKFNDDEDNKDERKASLNIEI